MILTPGEVKLFSVQAQMVSLGWLFSTLCSIFMCLFLNVLRVFKNSSFVGFFKKKNGSEAIYLNKVMLHKLSSLPCRDFYFTHGVFLCAK